MSIELKTMGDLPKRDQYRLLLTNQSREEKKTLRTAGNLKLKTFSFFRKHLMKQLCKSFQCLKAPLDIWCDIIQIYFDFISGHRVFNLRCVHLVSKTIKFSNVNVSVLISSKELNSAETRKVRLPVKNQNQYRVHLRACKSVNLPL